MMNPLVRFRDSWLPFLTIFLVVLSGFWRLFFLNWPFYDDQAWLMSRAGSESLGAFLDTGFNQSRRPLSGVFLYVLYGIHTMSPAVAYVIWDILTVVTVAVAGIMLYLLMDSMWPGRRTMALVAGCLVTIAPLDFTMPAFVLVCYRIAVAGSIASLLLTKKAAQAESGRAGLIWGALALSAVSSLVMQEGTIMYEPARFVLIWMIFRSDGVGNSARRALRAWTPFVALTLGVALYKVFFKPYGVYAGFYSTDFSHFFDPALYVNFMRTFLLGSWAGLFIYARQAGLLPIIIGTATAGTVAFALSFHRGQDNKEQGMGPAVLGLWLLVPPSLLYLSIGDAPNLSEESRHGILLSPGYAMFVAGVVGILIDRVGHSNISRGILVAGVSILIGAGVFFHNVNLSVYDGLIQQEKRFWSLFVQRFPILPARADFFFDVDPPRTIYKRMNMYYFFQFEYPVNTLYPAPDMQFRRYHVYAMQDMNPERYMKDHARFGRRSGWGDDAFDTDKMVFVYYRGGEMLVNSEILSGYTDLPYASWIANNSSLPFQEPMTIRTEPKRLKLEGNVP